eukprot:GHVN01064658.1.p2 GENE.GHVN01064658.1~~GHVN01064658.1.p2  ORF type:complete len:146 (-),score=23.29 GHVN01064658.1:286-723(-)
MLQGLRGVQLFWRRSPNHMGGHVDKPERWLVSRGTRTRQNQDRCGVSVCCVSVCAVCDWVPHMAYHTVKKTKTLLTQEKEILTDSSFLPIASPALGPSLISRSGSCATRNVQESPGPLHAHFYVLRGWRGTPHPPRGLWGDDRVE